MQTATTGVDAPSRPSRLVAEALAQRDGPQRIVHQASRLGLPAGLTHAMVAACGATAVDPGRKQRRPSTSA